MTDVAYAGEAVTTIRRPAENVDPHDTIRQQEALIDRLMKEREDWERKATDRQAEITRLTAALQAHTTLDQREAHLRKREDEMLRLEMRTVSAEEKLALIKELAAIAFGKAPRLVTTESVYENVPMPTTNQNGGYVNYEGKSVTRNVTRTAEEQR